MGSQVIPGWSPEWKLDILRSYAAQLSEEDCIVEVGTFCGRSAYAMLENFAGKLFCIDIWPYNDTERRVGDHYSNALGDHTQYYSKENCERNLAVFGDRVSLVKASSPNIPVEFDKTLKLVFLDGAHDFHTVYSELELFYNVAGNRTIIVDDYGHVKYPGLAIAVKKFVHENNLNVEIIFNNTTSGLAVIKK